MSDISSIIIESDGDGSESYARPPAATFSSSRSLYTHEDEEYEEEEEENGVESDQVEGSEVFESTRVFNGNGKRSYGDVSAVSDNTGGRFSSNHQGDRDDRSESSFVVENTQQGNDTSLFNASTLSTTSAVQREILDLKHKIRRLSSRKPSNVHATAQITSLAHQNSKLLLEMEELRVVNEDREAENVKLRETCNSLMRQIHAESGTRSNERSRSVLLENELRKEKERGLALQKQLDDVLAVQKQNQVDNVLRSVSSRSQLSHGRENSPSELGKLTPQSEQVLLLKKHIANLETKAARLAQEVDTKEDEIQALQSDKESFEPQMTAKNEHIASLSNKIASLEADLHQFETLFGNVNPNKLAGTLRHLRKENESLKQSLSSLESSNATLRKENDATLTSVYSLRRDLSNEKSKRAVAEQKTSFEKNELETFKRLVSMYDAKDTSSANTQTLSLLESVTQERDVLLEKVSHYEALFKPHFGDTSVLTPLEKMERALYEAHRANEILERERSRLLEQAEDISDYVRLGAYNSKTTQVLQLVDNPQNKEHSIRQTTLDALKKENGDLLKQVASLQKDATAEIETVPLSSLTRLENEVNNMKNTLENKAKLQKRLQEAFAQRADEMRRITASLLGYRIDIQGTGKVKLSSIYSQSKESALFFTNLTEGSHGPKDVEFSNSGDDLEKLKGLAQTWIEERQCIPGFLSSLTLDYVASKL